MKLSDDIRNLAGRKRLHRDKRLKAACHEASHCIVALKTDIPFEYAQVANLSEFRTGQDPATAVGKVVGSVPDTGQEISAAMVSYAGHVFESLVNPHQNDLYLMLTGSMNDMKQTIEWVTLSEWVDDSPQSRQTFIDDTLRPRVRAYLIENWTVVMRVGEALTEEGSLSYDEIVRLTGRTP